MKIGCVLKLCALSLIIVHLQAGWAAKRPEIPQGRGIMVGGQPHIQTGGGGQQGTTGAGGAPRATGGGSTPSSGGGTVQGPTTGSSAPVGTSSTGFTEGAPTGGKIQGYDPFAKGVPMQAPQLSPTLSPAATIINTPVVAPSQQAAPETHNVVVPIIHGIPVIPVPPGLIPPGP